MRGRKAERRSSTFRRILRAFGVTCALLLAPCGFSGCSPVASPPLATPILSIDSSPILDASDNNTALRAKKNPVHTAEIYLEQTRQRVLGIPQDPEFNGYQQLATIPARTNGLFHFATLLNKGKEAEFLSKFAELEKQESSPLREDIAIVSRALEKPTISAPLPLSASTAKENSHRESFSKVVSSLVILPKLRSQSLDEDEDEDLGGTWLALKVGRKLCLDAHTIEQYLLGLELEQTALDALTELLKTKSHSAEELQIFITRLQMEIGSPQELLQVLDVEYMLALQELEAKKLAPVLEQNEKLGLAALYLAQRPYITNVLAPVGNLKGAELPPELKEAPWAQKRLDFRDDLKRSRTILTQKASLELIAALEIHRQTRGAYPLKLEELTPGILTRIPDDSLSQNGAFTYQLGKEGYKLTSVTVEPQAPTTVWSSP